MGDKLEEIFSLQSDLNDGIFAKQQIKGPDGVFVEQIDLDYVLLTWQPTLQDGKAFTQQYGDAVGYRYSRAEDRGIFWSNDPGKPIGEMVRELDLELPAELLERNRQLHRKFRRGEIEPRYR